jgi:CheY-like chemotaxis protein
MARMTSLSTHAQPSNDANNRRPQILLVEDDAANQLVLQRMLEHSGAISVIANNGKEALDKITLQHWDLILMDCQMPVMDGLDASRAIRAMASPFCHIPIVAVTANIELEDKHACLNAGMDDYYSKPLRLQQVREILTRYTEPGKA